MLNVIYEKQFKKDYKKAIKRGLDTKELNKVINLLVNQKPLPRKYRNHKLKDSRRYKNSMDCHINGDWVLVYRIDKTDLILYLIATGTHSDLF